MMNNINIPRQSLPNIKNEKINIDTDNENIRRYIVRRYDDKFFEVTQDTYNRVKNNPFFEVLILNWYIKGTKDFVREQNTKELQRGEQKLKGIKRVIVNPLQFYINDIRK